MLLKDELEFQPRRYRWWTETRLETTQWYFPVYSYWIQHNFWYAEVLFSDWRLNNKYYHPNSLLVLAERVSLVKKSRWFTRNRLMLLTSSSYGGEQAILFGSMTGLCCVFHGDVCVRVCVSLITMFRLTLFSVGRFHNIFSHLQCYLH